MTGQTEGAAFGGYGNGGCFFGTLCSGATGGVIGYSYERPDYHYDENGNIKPEWRGLKFSYPPYASNSAADLLSFRGGRWTSLDASFARCFAIF